MELGVIANSAASEQSAIHMASAFSAEARLVLAQEKVDEKSNEITATPKLIDMLNLKGATVTFDTMGCQKAIAQKIIESDGHYVTAVKGNQKSLCKAIKDHFNNFFDMKNNKNVDVSVMEGASLNRLAKRECLVTDSIDWLKMKDDWVGIKSCVAILSRRTINGKESTEYRYYINSRPANAEQDNKIIRSHWAIENSFHGFLMWYSMKMMVVFMPNMAMIKHVVMNKLRIAQSHYPRKISLKGLRKSAGWNDDSLLSILCQRI